ncbi:type II toxin-antitoxin system VapC family toxin [Allochromatium palmeri]|uniref:PIN domain-containing protein n=1 Tax=Allochromatium palmeri TaxID=231048 RepID=A0A6N8E8Q7_9GAMM|nr:type II toxin-antitoxin system VapC family toxin [Allochromatium palmeri]MTW19708.1 PIN domain-containing protein [Allochromatium palmeri]
MIGLDTNVLARYYVQDESDAEAQHQHEAARTLIESGVPLMVCTTVLLEFEWVMRGYYGFSPTEIATVMQHVLSLSHVEIEERDRVVQAISHAAAGLEFADALHLSSYRNCDRMASFDDRKLARRAKRLNLTPRIFVPQ